MKTSGQCDLGRDSHWRDVQARLAGCGTLLEFRHVTSGPLAGVNRLHGATFCQHRTICRMCAIRRSAKIVQSYLPALQAAARSLPSRGRIVFVTLTVRDGAALGDCLDELQDGLSRLVGNCRKVRQRSGDHPLKPILGGVFSVEMKRGQNSNLWHPHAHGLLVCDRPLDFGALRRTWSSTLGYQAVAWCKNVKPDADGLLGGALEAFKYATKFEGLAPSDRLQVYLSSFGRRLLRSFGCLRAVDVPEDLLDAPLDWDSLEWVSLLLHYRAGSFVPAAPARASAFKAWDAGLTFAQEPLQSGP